MTQLTRRRFIAWSSLAAVLQHKVVRDVRAVESSSDGEWLFFSMAEGAFVSAVADVLIPPDEESPSATEAGVVVYIDHQLAGAYGAGRYQYMRGPFEAGTPQQGYQLGQVPGQLYRGGIAAVDKFVRTKYGVPGAASLAGSELTRVIEDMEAGRLDEAGFPVSEFFRALRGNAVEGYFSDPTYGGNRGMAGWTFLGFPGVDTYYADDIERDGLRYTRVPTGLKERLRG